jgi:serpin B
MKRLLPVMLLVGCSDSPGIPEVRSSLTRDLQLDVSASDMTALVAGNTEFATDLYKQVRGTPGNLFMSPHSISTALAMTWAGAEVETAAQMADTLHFTLPAVQQHAAFDQLDLDLASRATNATSDTIPLRLTTANGIFGQDGKTFLMPFLDTLALNYDAGVRVLDFAGDSEGSRLAINQWVEDQTNDRITNLLPEGSINEWVKLVLADAIYFNGAWAIPFDETATSDQAFSTAGSAQVTVPFLHATHESGYATGDGWKAAELLYDGGDLVMDVIVPDDLEAFEASLSPQVLGSVVATMQLTPLELSLPKFKFDAPLDLTRALMTLGMTDAFVDADFSGMDGTRDLAIQAVLHKGFISVDEFGTEATAATAILAGDTVSFPDPATLVVDHPFLFLIRDKPTGAILFVGRVVDPS